MGIFGHTAALSTDTFVSQQLLDQGMLNNGPSFEMGHS